MAFVSCFSILKERERLKEILETIRPEGTGIIARTVAEGQSYKTLKFDFNMLMKIWKDVSRKSQSIKAPGLNIEKQLTKAKCL